jgi:hypothetical protein
MIVIFQFVSRYARKQLNQMTVDLASMTLETRYPDIQLTCDLTYFKNDVVETLLL